MRNMGKWVLVDALNLAYRCFYAVPALSRSDGFPTNALHGWVRSLWMLADQQEPDTLLIVFDLGEDPNKKRLLPEYKENRKEMPEALAQQLPYLKESAVLMGFPVIELFQTEADDLIATVARRRAECGDSVLIVSGDKDLAQCVNDRVHLLVPSPSARGKPASPAILDAQKVREKFGVPPEAIPDYLALIGDSSDNIPGIAGVGPKTAAKWLGEFGTVANVMQNSEKLRPERLGQKVSENRDLLSRNLELVRLNDDVELPEPESREPDLEALSSFFNSMEMNNATRDAEKRFARAGLSAITNERFE